jgi:Bacterial Ig-like domain/Bacterial Ig domain
MALGDGLANAPAGTPELSTLLNGYAVRPTWNVAGVDYAVGYASGTILRDPSTISMAGVSVDTVNHVVSISGSNITLSGYDFSLNGGWGVSVNGGTGDTIQNSKFIVGSNGYTPIYVSPNASNVTIQNNLIDGGGTSTQILVGVNGVGTTTIQYNLIQNASGQNLVMSSYVGGENWTVQYNVIANAGLGFNSGAHGDWIQTYNDSGKNTNSFQLNYNTFIQDAPIADGRTQGISAFSANSGSTAGCVQTESINNNTIIANNGSYVNYGIIVDTTRVIGSATIQNNYFDTTNIGSRNGGGGSWEFVGDYNAGNGGPYHGTVTQSNNVNMVAGTYLGGQSGTPPSGTSTTAPPPAAPTIASFSPDTGVLGDGITNHSTVTLSGTAAASSTVKVFDGSAQIGTATANSNGSWSYTSALSETTHTLTATATNSAGLTSAASSVLKVTPDTKAPAAPTIVSDTVNGAHQVVASGKAEANSTIKVYDGTSEVGTAVTNSTGIWNVTTNALSAGSHSLTATATDAAGNTSASLAFDPVIASTSVAAPVIASLSTDTGLVRQGISADNTLELKGTAAAGSTVKVYDGSTQIGMTTATSAGTWDYITQVLSDAKHALTATATNSSGQISTPSTAVTITVDTKAPVAPTIASNTISSTNHVLLSGSAELNSTITILDGTTPVGTATTDPSGVWSVTTTSALSTAPHHLTATATDAAGNVSAKSTAVDLAMGVDTVAPNAPVILSDSAVHHRALVSGTAEAGSTVKVYEGTTLLGTAMVDAHQHFSVTTSPLKHGTHTFVATASDAAGNTSLLSQPFDPAIGSHRTHSTGASAPGDATASTVELGGIHQHRDHTATIKGTAEGNSQIRVFEDNTAMGTTTTNAEGVWHFSTSCAASHGVHTYKAQQLDHGGHVVASSGNAIVGSRGGETLSGTASNDVFAGHGGHDTFVFAPNFGRDTITDFAAHGRSHDVVQFSKSVFDNFADVLAHATQIGHDVILAGAADSLTLKNVKLSALDKTDFHFA